MDDDWVIAFDIEYTDLEQRSVGRWSDEYHQVIVQEHTPHGVANGMPYVSIDKAMLSRWLTDTHLDNIACLTDVDGLPFRAPSTHPVRHNLSVPLVVDRSQNPSVLDGEALRTWAQARTVFVSSDMRDLLDERRALATEMKAMGLNVVMFEDLGGREDDAETAYFDGVARSDIYLAVIADRYGRMLPNGRSPTHEEYREAGGWDCG